MLDNLLDNDRITFRIISIKEDSTIACAVQYDSRASILLFFTGLLRKSILGKVNPYQMGHQDVPNI